MHTDGRVEWGLRAGGFREAICDYGGAQGTPGEALSAVGEPIEVMRALWRPATPEQTISFPGKFYQLNNAQSGPAPAHPISIWIGANRPRMLKLIGRMADGWIVSASYVPPENIPALQAIIDDAAQAAGHATTAVRRAYNVAGTILRPGSPAMAARRRGIIAGPVSQWTDELMRYYSDLRMDTFILWPIGDEEAQIRTFAEEVVPALKERINSR